MPAISFSIHSITPVTSDTKTFEFRFDQSFPYLPGQFLTIIRKVNDREVRRQYSFSSHPAMDKYPAITVKRIANGELSRWLFDEVVIGDRLCTTGASGLFTMPETGPEHNTFLLLAAGSGISPVFSLIKELLFCNTDKRVILIYSNHFQEETIFLKEIRILQQKFSDRFFVEFLFSNNKDLRRARLGKLLLEELYKQYVESPQRTLAYVCGPYDYMQMVRITLRTEGLPPDNVRSEIFIAPYRQSD
jgi:ferredoxin-NADP reductase